MGEGEGILTSKRQRDQHPLGNLVGVGLPALAAPNAQPEDDGAEQRDQNNDEKHFAKFGGIFGHSAALSLMGCETR